VARQVFSDDPFDPFKWIGNSASGYSLAGDFHVKNVEILLSFRLQV
jgi:hypothetical protein